MIKLSIVVPVYGVEPWIERCLKSIVEDPGFRGVCELIVVDDGSPDNSMEIAERVCDGALNVCFIRQVNQGLGAARNAGASVARGKYLWFVDSDDWLTDGGLAQVLQALDSCPGLEVLNIDYVISDGTHSTVSNNAKPGIEYSGEEYLRLSIVQNPVQYYIYSLEFYRRRNLSFEIGVYHEDALFTPLALYGAKHVLRLAKDCYVYNLRDGSIMNSGNPMKHAMDMLRVVKALEAFRSGQNSTRANVLAIYIALAVGGVYYYWKRLGTTEREQVVKALDVSKLLRMLVRAQAYKYIFAIARMRYFYSLT